MVRNEDKYQQAVQFRARGFTLEEIAKICEVSKSTVSKWLKNNVISDSVTKQNKKRAGQENAKRLRLVHKARTGERTLRYKEVERSAETEYKHYKDTPAFVAGLMLYFANGDALDQRKIRFSSKEAQSHKIFITFALAYLGVEKTAIHIWLQLYSDLSEEKCMKYWRKHTSLPYSQFYKNQVMNVQSKHKTLHHGVGNTIIGSTVLKRKLNRWVELLVKDLSK